MTDQGLSTAELTQMRADIAQLFPDTCNILQLSQVSDGAGGQTDTWGTATGGTAVPCRVDYRTGREKETAGAVTPYQQAIISLGYAVTVTPANRVQVGSNIFSIQAGNAGQSWKAVTRLTCELIA